MVFILYRNELKLVIKKMFDVDWQHINLIILKKFSYIK